MPYFPIHSLVIDLGQTGSVKKVKSMGQNINVNDLLGLSIPWNITSCNLSPWYYCDAQTNPTSPSHPPAANHMLQLHAPDSLAHPSSKTADNRCLLVPQMRTDLQVGYIVVRQHEKMGQQVQVWDRRLGECHCLSHTPIHR